MSESQKNTSGRIFYGWINVVIAFIVMFFTVGVVVTAYSATSMYVIAEWGISNTENSILINARTITAIIAMALAASYYKKLSVRVGLFIGVAMGALAYVLFALADGMTLGIPAMILAGISHGLSGMYGLTIVVENWFVKKKSFVLGVLTTASGFTTMIMPQLLVQIVEAYSLEASFWIVAVMFAVVAVIILLFLREKPAEGERYGEGETAETSSAKRTVSERYSPNLGQCVCMLVACLMIGPACYSQGQVRTLAFTTVGFDAATAAGFLSTYGLFIIIGKLIFGWINDRVPMRKMTVIWFGLVAVSHVILANTGADWFNGMWAQSANILYSLGGPICTVGLSLYGLELAKGGDTKAWIRNYLVIYNIGGLVFTQLAGVIADKTGNYSAVFYMFAVCALAGAVLSQIAYTGAYRRAGNINGKK
ncbi:MFS transporter [Mediterraneibacter sp. NSJ-55]|uniref:MFS transporter n=1 Tax=Mediterraneibacter hominis TaxID=2763054 RepID=A0A923RSU4_9FIRM|nr:MFS transporter [Mediterraneibacter hominis]MBC5689657.1 MFS transporter [Mediterraneibacter hominis]